MAAWLTILEAELLGVGVCPACRAPASTAGASCRTVPRDGVVPFHLLLGWLWDCSCGGERLCDSADRRQPRHSWHSSQADLVGQSRLDVPTRAQPTAIRSGVRPFPKCTPMLAHVLARSFDSAPQAGLRGWFLRLAAHCARRRCPVAREPQALGRPRTTSVGHRRWAAADHRPHARTRWCVARRERCEA